MPETHCQVSDVYLQPGELFFAREPTIIRTILGSCVGITFWSQRLGIGALCHGMLPRYPGARGRSLEDGYRYVDYCIRDLARQFDKLGIDRAEIQVKVFGGADVLLVTPSDSSRLTVGRLNCETAMEVLHDEGFEVTASSLGGTAGLKIHFDTGTGEVLLQRLN